MLASGHSGWPLTWSLPWSHHSQEMHTLAHQPYASPCFQPACVAMSMTTWYDPVSTHTCTQWLLHPPGSSQLLTTANGYEFKLEYCFSSMFSAIISACTYSASTLVNQTRTTVQSVVIVIVPTRKISILSPEGEKTRRLCNILVNWVYPPPLASVWHIYSTLNYWMGTHIVLSTTYQGIKCSIFCNINWYIWWNIYLRSAAEISHTYAQGFSLVGNKFLFLLLEIIVFFLQLVNVYNNNHQN